MTTATVVIVEPSIAEARFVGAAIEEAVETGATAQRFRPVHLQEIEDALIVMADERVDAVILGSTTAPLSDLARIVERAPEVPALLIVGADERRTGLAALRQGAQEYLVRGEFDHIPLARAIENAIERHKYAQSLRAVGMRDHRTGLLSANAFGVLCGCDTRAGLLVGSWESDKLDATDAAAVWVEAVGPDAWPARIGAARFGAVLSDGASSPEELREHLAGATGVRWSVARIAASDLVRE